MAHHLGIGCLPGPLFTVPVSPGNFLTSVIPPLYEDADHVNGVPVERTDYLDARNRRYSLRLASGEMSALLTRHR